MRQGFTLIELMIVIAIIAIIAAIAIPNLLESRITANESAAATSLKSGVFPAQVGFQAGGHIDVDLNGRGCYAAAIPHLAGAAIAPGGVPGPLDPPNKAIKQLGPEFNNTSTTAATDGTVTAFNNGVAPNAILGFASGGMSRVGDYGFGIVRAQPAAAGAGGAGDGNAESYWAAYATPIGSVPATYDGSKGRKAFAIQSGGTLLQTLGTTTLPGAGLGMPVISVPVTGMFITDPTVGNPGKGPLGSPYVK